MKKAISYFILILIGIVFIGTLVFLYKKSQKPPVVYKLDSPVTTTIVKKTVAIGKVIPRREIEVKSQVSGVVEKVFVVAGQRVKNGDILAQIKLRPSMLNVNNAESRVQTAKINFQNVETEYQRQKKLFEQRLVSEADYNKSLLSYNLQREALRDAENNLMLLKSGASKNSDKVSNLVPATLDGMVLDVPNKEGASVIEASTFQGGTTLATLADMNNMIFEGLVDESEVAKLHEGMELMLNVGALQGKTFSAVLEYISPKGTSDQGTIKFQIRAAIKLQNELFLRANYSANADIVLAKRENVLAINEGNLIVEDSGSFVEVETGTQKFEKREIKTGLSDGINIEVLSGLTLSDKIKHR